VPPSRESGFNISDYDAAFSNYTLLHEIAHNFGAGHSNSAGLVNDSRGYRLPGVFRTVLAYSCKDERCLRRGYVSNPMVNYRHRVGDTVKSYPTGIAGERNNARTLSPHSPDGAAICGTFAPSSP
jgi:hypothetical protein